MTSTPLYITIGKILHPIGLAFSSLVLLTLIVLACIDSKHVNRITIRLIGAIAVGDFINHLGEYLSTGTRNLVGTPYCFGLSAFRTFGRLFYAFSNLAIAFHLYRAIVRLKKSTWKFELIIWLVMMIVIGLIMLAFHFLGIFTGTIGKGACAPGSDNPVFSNIKNFLFGSLYILIMSICVYVTFAGRKNLNDWINAYASVQISEEAAQREFKTEQRKMAERSFLYPLSTVITLSGEAVFVFTLGFGYRPIPGVLIYMTIGNGLAGILTAAAFAIDPAVWKSLQIVRLQVINWYQGIKNPNQENIKMNSINNSAVDSPLQFGP